MMSSPAICLAADCGSDPVEFAVALVASFVIVALIGAVASWIVGRGDK